jgi:hypothetical protein
LFDTFMKRPDVTRKVIEQGNQVTQKYDALQKQVDAAKAVTDSAQSGAGGAAPQAAASGVTQQQLQETRESVQAAADQASAAISELQVVGVPIGWTRARFEDSRNAPWTTMLGLLLGGMLVGLGAPFWYKVVQALTPLRASARNAKDSQASPAAAAAGPAATSPTQVPTTAIEAFHAALGASLAAGVLGPSEEAVG